MTRCARPLTLEEKTQRVMREHRCDWHAARRILAKHSAVVRHYRKLAREAKAGRPQRVLPYAGPRVYLEVERRYES